MSIFSTITTLAATSITSALLDSSSLSTGAVTTAKKNAPPLPPAHEQTNSRKQSVLPEHRIVELPDSPPLDLRPVKSARILKSKNKSSTTRLREGRAFGRGGVMQPTGLPQNSIWTTMSYPIPRGPCLQKSSLISAGCSCQRFMVHPLKATTSFDCDGCGHHASFHKMKSHEEEVENAAKARVLTTNTGNGGRVVGLLQGRIESEEEEEEYDETVDEDGEFLEPERKKRVVAAGKKTVAPKTTSARGGKRKRVGEQAVIE
ncbi:hypothetical protein TWF481_010759 [Arthrobotrys musiformis]|uniref:Uncharacterized protein n=1 Tax=Arthrobotrys musiformis TaxID=47236 RepID=A0AAV9W2S7_9PEZI